MLCHTCKWKIKEKFIVIKQNTLYYGYTNMTECCQQRLVAVNNCRLQYDLRAVDEDAIDNAYRL